MELLEAKRKFVQLWGVVGSEWGINRTMAQIHALLMLSLEPLSAEEVMKDLHISRGNANMNLRELVNWRLVYKEIRQGERKEFFSAEKNVWRIAQRIAAERRKRELDPMLRTVEELLEQVQAKANQEGELKQFRQLLKDLQDLGRSSSRILDLVLKLDQSAFFKPLVRLMRL